MQETLNFPTTSTPTTQLSTHFFRKTPIFITFSSKTTANSLTFTPSKILPITPLKTEVWEGSSSNVRNLISNPNPDPNTEIVTDTNTNTNTYTDTEFREKALYLDSLGLDPLSKLPPSAIASAVSLPELKLLLDYLSSFGFSPPELRRIISMCPQILTLNLRGAARVFAFLLREARVPSTSLRHTIRRRPRLLVSNVETRLRPTMYFLQSIGIHDVHKYTDLLSCSVEERLLPKVAYFAKIGFCHRDAMAMFRKFPQLFGYSVKENFEPKLNYFVVEMGRDLKELREFPHYFSFSLERRIKPRHQCCVESGMCLSLSVMLKMKEEEFRKRLDACCSSSMPKSSSPLWCVNSEQ